MPNLYARLAAAKDDLNISGTTRDAELLRLIENVSRGFDEVTARRFYSEVATRYYDAYGEAHLYPGDDILAVTTLKVDEDGDGVYEKTLAANTDYWLWPDNESPKIRIDLNPQSAQISAFPDGRRRVEVAGLFGYSNETDLVTTLAEDDDGLETDLTLTSAAGFSVGETMVIGSEQFDITAIAANVITVTRAVNGTTAAVHANGAAVYRRRYPRPIEEAVTMQVIRFSREHQTGNAGNAGASDLGGYSFTSLYPAIRDLLAPFRIPVVA